MTKLEPAVDIAILTVIPRELEAARHALSLMDNARQKVPSGTIFYKGSISSILVRRNYRLVLSCIGQAGNPIAAAATTEVIELFHPQVVLLMGIAAGMRGKVKIGEVVISERVVPYEHAALIQNTDGTTRHQPRHDNELPPYQILQDLVHYSPNSKRLNVRFRTFGGEFPTPRSGQEKFFRQHVSNTIAAKIGTFTSGEKLLRDPTVLHWAREELHGKIESAEMEASGFAAACRRAKVSWLVFRGISDFGDRSKEDNFHLFASYAAAAVLADFLEYGLELDADTA